MKLLAFDTSTQWLSVAVCAGARVWQHSGAGGALASTTLLPLILGLLGEAGLRPGQLDAIVFGQGPGSFTGLRSACSVAQGLGFGAAVPVLPMPTLLAVAEEARHLHGALRVVAALDARMDQLYVARYDFATDAMPWQAGVELLAPDDLSVPAGYCLAGNVLDAYAGRLPTAAPCHAVLPAATAMLRLAPAMLGAGLAVNAAQAAPLYIREKVARTSVERAADKARAQSGIAS
jgi:tRNA threonylcarbamoyladenosine biosynthesis protein TsaB